MAGVAGASRARGRDRWRRTAFDCVSPGAETATGAMLCCGAASTNSSSEPTRPPSVTIVGPSAVNFPGAPALLARTTHASANAAAMANAQTKSCLRCAKTGLVVRSVCVISAFARNSVRSPRGTSPSRHCRLARSSHRSAKPILSTSCCSFISSDTPSSGFSPFDSLRSLRALDSARPKATSEPAKQASRVALLSIQERLRVGAPRPALDAAVVRSPACAAGRSAKD